MAGGVEDDDRESFAALFERSPDAAGRRARVRVGDRVDVRIVAIGRDAVFADLGGKQEGYFERADLADAEGNLPVALGATVAATVASIDRATGQARLAPMFVRRAAGEAAAQPPARGPVLVEGARVRGKVTGIERYGVFVQIAGTSGRSGRGLVPLAESGLPRGADPKKHFEVGQDLEAKIVRIDDDGKIRLSIAALRADEERADYEAFVGSGGGASGSAPANAGSAPAPEGAPRDEGADAGARKPRDGGGSPNSFGTLGDLLAKASTKPRR